MTVYMHIFPNGKRYVGITMHDIRTRTGNGTGYKKNISMAEDIEKYGWNNVQSIICAEELDIPEACALEVQLIREFDTTNPEKGYNRSKGGDWYKYCKQLTPDEEQMNAILDDAAGKLQDMYDEYENAEMRAIILNALHDIWSMKCDRKKE